MSPTDSNSATELLATRDQFSIGLIDLLRDRRIQALLVMATLVRLVIGIDLWQADPLVRVPLSDPAYYHAWASALAAGESFRGQDPYWLPPLYPWLLSFLYRWVGPSIGAVVVLQAIAGLLSTALLILLSFRVAGRRAALAAGVLWTLYLPVLFFETRLLPVNVALPLCLGALNLLVGCDRQAAVNRESSRFLRPCGAGLLLGLAAMARPNLLLTVPAIALAWIIADRGRLNRAPQMLALVLGLLVGIAPSALENHRRNGEWIAVTANGGINFWFGNNEHAHGTFHAPAAEWGSIGTQREVSIALATDALGSTQPVSEREASAWWFNQGIDYLVDSPTEALRLWALKLGDTLSSTEFGIQYFPTAIRRLAPSLWIGFLPFGLLLALGILGLRGDDERLTRGRTVLIAWLLAGLAASLLYFTYSRFRLPILIAWMPFAGRGAVRLLDLVRGRASVTIPCTLFAVVLLGVSFVPFEGDYPRQLAANTLLDAGLAARDLGEPERSRELIEESLRLVPVNPRAEVELGRHLRATGDETAALLHFEAAQKMPGDFFVASFELWKLLLGARMEALRNPKRAIGEMRSWLVPSTLTTPTDLDIQLLLASALLDRPEFAREPDEAVRLIKRVLERNPAHPRALLLLEYLESD